MQKRLLPAAVAEPVPAQVVVAVAGVLAAEPVRVPVAVPVLAALARGVAPADLEVLVLQAAALLPRLPQSLIRQSMAP